MALNRSLRPVALGRRRMHIPGRKRIIVPSPPPSGDFPSYLAWEFENNLFDTTNTYTINGTGNYTPGIIGNAGYISNYLFNAPNVFRINWNTPFAVTAWVFLKFNNRVLDLMLNADTYNPLSYRFRFASNSEFLLLDSLGVSQSKSFGNLGYTLNAFNFFCYRYDPANYKVLEASCNNGSFVDQIFTSDFKVDGDYSNPSLRIAPSFSDLYLDQLTFWYGSVLTDQNISDLYNSGAGRNLP